MDKIIKINKASDFDFEYKLNESYSDSPFRLTFFTIDKEDNFYIVYYDGTEYSSCTPTDHNSVIAHLDKPELYCGCLRIEVEYFIDSASFRDGIYNDIRVEKTNVYIVREKSDVTSVTYDGSPIINFDPTNLTNNVEQALNEINDKSDELEQALSELEDTQERANDLIDELSELKDNINELVNRDELDDYAKLEDLGPFMTEDEVSDWLNDYYTKNECNTRYYTKTQVDAILNTLQPEIDLSAYVTKAQLSSCGYLTHHQDLSEYATKADLASVATGGTVNLDDYITQAKLSSMGYLTSHQDLSDYATMTWVHGRNFLTLEDIDDLGNINVSLDGYVKYEDLDLEGFVTQAQLSNAGYLTSHQDLSNYATKAWVQNQNYLTQHQDLSDYATKSYIESKNYITQHQDLSDYVTINNLNNRLSSYATTEYVETRLEEIEAPDLSAYALKTDIPEQLWERGIGSYSLVSYSYNIAEGEYSVSEGFRTAAIGAYSHAEGLYTYAYGYGSHTEGRASYTIGSESHAEGYHNNTYGQYSHAEGYKNITYGLGSHAEGQFNVSYGDGSHTEGYNTVAYGQGSHGEGRYNKFNGDTLSSIGIGTSEQDRKNAFEVMQNGDIYAYGIGNYDGTNPTEASSLKQTIDSLNDRIDNIVVGDDIELSNYVSKTELSSCGYVTSSYAESRYLTRHQSLDDYATKSYVMNAITNAQIGGGDGGDIDLNDYVTKTELSSCGYLTAHQSLADYATKSYVLDKINSIPSPSSIDLSSYATKLELASYVSKSELSNCGYITSTAIENRNYATESYVLNKVNNIQPIVYQNISIWQGTEAQYNALPNYTSYQLYLIAQE